MLWSNTIPSWNVQLLSWNTSHMIPFQQRLAFRWRSWYSDLICYWYGCLWLPTPPSSGDCSQPLLRCDTSNQESLRPIKPFVYHSFHDYLAGLLLIKDLEEVMDEAWNWLRDVVEGSLPDFILDVWGVEFLRPIKGLTPGMFIINRGSEGHYVFPQHWFL